MRVSNLAAVLYYKLACLDPFWNTWPRMGSSFFSDNPDKLFSDKALGCIRYTQHFLRPNMLCSDMDNALLSCVIKIRKSV